MKLIYQLGRLDTNMEQQKFKIGKDNEDYTKKAELSSLFLKKYFKEKNNDEVKVILLYPVSLPFNPNLIRDNSKLHEISKKKIEEIWEREDEYFNNPYNYFESYFPYCNEKDDFRIIHSLGSYSYGKKRDDAKKVQFDTTYGDIVLEIFLDMIKRYLKMNNSISEIYIDISSGHNIYISAMLEAFRHFATFTSLRHWVDKRKRPKFFITICDPILPGSENIYQVYIEEQRFNVFLESPIKRWEFKDIKSENFEDMKKMLFDKQTCKLLVAVLERFLMTFSAIKNNIPLYLFDTYTIIDEPDEIQKLLDEIIEYLHVEIAKNYKNSPKLDKNKWIKIINTLGFYLGIIDVINHANILKYKKQKGVKKDDIKNIMKNIYNKFGLTNNIDILSVELDKLSPPGRRIAADILRSNFRNLLNRKNRDRIQRNFFAHCGLEENFVIVNEENGDIYVEYIDDLPELREMVGKMLLERI